MRRIVVGLALLGGLTSRAVAQSSVFGVRGLGIPQAPISARAVGMNGSGSLLDGMSGTNPAAITSTNALSIGFNVVQNWRSSTSPGGEGSGADAGVPFVTVVNRIKETPYYFAGSFGTYTDRDFGFVTTDTTDINGTPVGFRDSLESRGGTSDFRLALGYRSGNRIALGFGFHFITGSNRITLNRAFTDSTYAPVRQRSELAYNAVGFSLGAVYHPTERLLLAAALRHDGQMNVDRDSVAAYTYDLPWTLGGSAQYQLGNRGTINAEVSYTTWADADAEIVASGGVGAENTLNASLGAEVPTSPAEPGRLPLRVGIRTRQLPFPLTPGQQPTEFSVAAGTGVRFAKGHAAADMALQRVWRTSDDDFSEDAWVLSLGLTLKP